MSKSVSSYFGGVNGATSKVLFQTLEAIWGLAPDSVQIWQPGAAVTSPQQIRVYNGNAWFSPSATSVNPVSMPVTPPIPPGNNTWSLLTVDTANNGPFDYGSLSEPVNYLFDDGSIA